MINSSVTNGSFPPHLSSVDSFLLSYVQCILSSLNSRLLMASYAFHIVLILPLCVFIFYHHLRQQCRQTSASASTSHSDNFSCHVAFMELISVCGFAIGYVAIVNQDADVMLVGILVSKFTWYGETFFHILTCLECYLAVVHPFIYLRVKGDKEIRIRIITTSCVWVLCVVATVLALKEIVIFIDLGVMILSLVVISFCCLSVLCVLVHPRPGEPAESREKVDPSKLRAFYTTVALLAVLLLRLGWGLVWTSYDALGGSDVCLIVICTFWFNLPSSLVLPLMFLQRTGKLQCCKKNIQQKKKNTN